MKIRIFFFIGNHNIKETYEETSGGMSDKSVSNLKIYDSNEKVAVNGQGDAGYVFINKTKTAKNTIRISPKQAGNTLYGTNVITCVPYKNLQYGISFQMIVELGYTMNGKNYPARPSSASFLGSNNSFYQEFAGSKKVKFANVEGGSSSNAGTMTVNGIGYGGGSGNGAETTTGANQGSGNKDKLIQKIKEYLSGLGVSQEDMPEDNKILNTSDWTWKANNVKIWKERWTGIFRVPYGDDDYNFCIDTSKKVSDKTTTDTSFSGCDCNSATSVCPDGGDTDVESNIILTQ